MIQQPILQAAVFGSVTKKLKGDLFL